MHNVFPVVLLMKSQNADTRPKTAEKSKYFQQVLLLCSGFCFYSLFFYNLIRRRLPFSVLNPTTALREAVPLTSKIFI